MVPAGDGGASDSQQLMQRTRSRSASPVLGQRTRHGDFLGTTHLSARTRTLAHYSRPALQGGCPRPPLRIDDLDGALLPRARSRSASPCRGDAGQAVAFFGDSYKDLLEANRLLEAELEQANEDRLASIGKSTSDPLPTTSATQGQLGRRETEAAARRGSRAGVSRHAGPRHTVGLRNWLQGVDDSAIIETRLKQGKAGKSMRSVTHKLHSDSPDLGDPARAKTADRAAGWQGAALGHLPRHAREPRGSRARCTRAGSAASKIALTEPLLQPSSTGLAAGDIMPRARSRSASPRMASGAHLVRDTRDSDVDARRSGQCLRGSVHAGNVTGKSKSERIKVPGRAFYGLALGLR